MQATNHPTPDPGTKSDSHQRQERDALDSKAGDSRRDIKQNAHQAYDELREGTRKIARESGSYLKNVGAEQQHRLVVKLDEYRDALKAASNQLESDDDTVAARNIRKATGGLECVVDYLRESEPNDLLSDASRIARKRPELVFGGLFLAGLGIARIMKSSARERRREEHSSNNNGSPVGSGDITPSAGSKPGKWPTPPAAGPPSAPAAKISR